MEKEGQKPSQQRETKWNWSWKHYQSRKAEQDELLQKADCKRVIFGRVAPLPESTWICAVWVRADAPRLHEGDQKLAEK